MKKESKSEESKWWGIQIYHIFRNLATVENFTDLYSALEKNGHMLKKSKSPGKKYRGGHGYQIFRNMANVHRFLFCKEKDEYMWQKSIFFSASDEEDYLC